MSGFKPKKQAQTGESKFTYPDPAESGTQAVRVSLIVDMGIQERPNFEEVYNENDPKHVEALENRGATIVVPEYGNDKGKECISIPQKPKQGVAVFVDLVGDLVDYGGQIGEKHYRLMLNKNFKGEVSPITFAAVPPTKDGGVWTFHGGSMLTKLAKATGKTEIIEAGDSNMDISLLLGEACLMDVDVSHTTKGDKTYTNVRSGAPVKLIKTMEAPELVTEAKLVTFEDATAEDVKFIRKDVRAKIMEAEDFVGSQMEAAFVEAGFCEKQSTAPSPVPPALPDSPDGDDSDSPF